MNKNQRTFVIGDIHGGYRALVQVLKMVNFDYDNDKLISLGDICDGWSETPEVIEELLRIKNLIYIKGNHDSWAYKGLTEERNFFSFSTNFEIWLNNGGQATKNAYIRRADLLEKHLDFLNKAALYYLDEKNRLFVHGGIRPGIPIENTPENVLILDRNFWYTQYAGGNEGRDYEEIYIGHTPTILFNERIPMNRKNTWLLDTGAAFTGSLTIMNIDTKEYWQSEPVRKLYPLEKGRNKKSWQEEFE